MKHVHSIDLEDKKIVLKASQAQDNGEVQKMIDMSISTYNDKITSNISMMINDNHKILMKKLSALIRHDI